MEEGHYQGSSVLCCVRDGADYRRCLNTRLHTGRRSHGNRRLTIMVMDTAAR